MGFSLSSFLGGAAGGAGQVFDEQRAEAQNARITKEERQWQIATEERSASRSRKATRAAKQKENDEAYEKLVFHYGEKNATAMMPKGRGYIGEAIKQGQAYNAAGFDGKTMVTVGETKEFTELPKTEGVVGAAPTALSGEASTITFKPLPQKAAKEKISWEARLVSLVDEENALGIIGDDPAQQAKLTDIERRRKNTLKQHAQWKSDTAADGVASTAMDFSTESRTSFIKGTTMRVARNFDLVETSLDTGLERILNPAEGVQRIDYFTSVDNALEASYLDAVVEKDRDKSITNAISLHREKTTELYKTYVERNKETVTMPEGYSIDTSNPANPKLVASDSTSPIFSREEAQKRFNSELPGYEYGATVLIMSKEGQLQVVIIGQDGVI